MEMESISNIMGAAKGKRYKPPRFDQDENVFYEDEEMAAHSLVLLSHNSSSSYLPRPRKRIMKAMAKEFHSADSPYHCEKKSSYECKTCGKKFISFHALGGHRASCCHTTTIAQKTAESEKPNEKRSISSNNKMKVHECRICCRVFSSGQALGGHKRTHSTTLPPKRSSATQNVYEQKTWLDLNLPAPLEMENDSMLAISDYEKFNPGLHCWMGGHGKRLQSDYNGAVAIEAERGMRGEIDFKRDLLMVTTVT